jgi:DNA ligase (NAD+)
MRTEYNIQNITVDCLLEMIKKQNTAYRAGTPIVTDAVYDAEIEKLKELDPENEWFKHVEPSPVSCKYL